MYAYFIDISQSSVETHLRCSGIYNNHSEIEKFYFNYQYFCNPQNKGCHQSQNSALVKMPNYRKLSAVCSSERILQIGQ